MWWNSPAYGGQHSPSTASLSPIPFSSNLELFDDPDPDWVGGQLEQARLQRSGFYRRLHSASQRSDDDIVALQKPWSIIPDDVDDRSSFEPHSSWRFYTSFDNGEWTRHAVPVLKVEEGTTATHNGAPKPKVSEVKKSACQAAESSLRRTRQPRTTAAELQRNRLRMRSGETMDSSAYGRWKLSSSVETGRNTATGGSFVDFGNISPEGHQSLDFMDELPARRVLSPRSDRFSPWREVTSPTVPLPRPRLDSCSSPKALLPVSSCTVDGIDVTFKEKVIIPTKYKTKENNTAAGTPETSKAEVARATSVEPESGFSSDAPKKRGVADASISCMTGQGEVQMVKSSEQGDVVLCGQVEGTRQETAQKGVEVEPPEVTSVEGNVDLDLICDLKHDQFINSSIHRLIANKFTDESSFDEFSEKYGITKNEGLKTKAETAHVTVNRNTNDARKTEQVVEKQKTILDDELKPHVGENLMSKKTSDNTENNFESSSGRGLGDDENHKQKAELTSKMATGLGKSDEKVSNSGDKVVKFVSMFFAEVNAEPFKEPRNSKNKLINYTVADTKDKNPPTVQTKADPEVFLQEDDNWVVEMAVKK